MNDKLIDRLVAGIVFLYALVLYLLTVAPTASFWDAGEFIAISHGLEVSHPPGAPFYMLVGRIFSMFVPAQYVAFSVNLISVLASAATILFTHLVIVRLVRIWQTPEEALSPLGRFIALAGGAIGALSFAATDSFWFNAVEAEVYASSMLFTAAVVWLILKWREQAQVEDHLEAGGGNVFALHANRYLILIAYLFGIAIGVHLLNLLAVFFISLIVFFAGFDRQEWNSWQRWLGIAMAGVASAVVFFLIYPGVIQWLPELMGKLGSPMLFIVVMIAVLVFAIHYTQRHHMPTANLIMLGIAAVLIGYSTYALIFIRSAANPPIDENDPETTEAIVSYLKREQYGSTPLLTGPSYDNAAGTVTEEEKLFPRRYDPQYSRFYARYDSDWQFFWQYQVGHMYVRYFLWNFVGKASDEQDAQPITGLIPGEGGDQHFTTPSERESRNAYYALPLLIGLIGCGFHFTRDWRRAFSVFVLFFLTGLGIIIYLNQTPMQPRERDYSYVASFFAFSLWIGIGAAGILQLVWEALRGKNRPEATQRVALIVGTVLLFVASPLNLVVENYYDHDRSGNYAAPDYAYNMLNSVARNGVIFTNGDNDTFPLWYLQEVEGERTDVRVANLSLLNTPWYIKQLKNQASHESQPIPMALSDQQIDQMAPIPWQPRQISLPVDPKMVVGGSEAMVSQDISVKIENPMVWMLEGRPYNQETNWLHIADQAALDIISTNAGQGWKRPIYFATTVSQDGQLDLQQYLQLEGQAFRVVPVKTSEYMGRVDPEITYRNLMNFRFRGLADPSVYYDESARRMIDNYRNWYAHAAEQLAQMGQKDKARALLDKVMKGVPFSTIAGDERSYVFLARGYLLSGDKKTASELLAQAEPRILRRMQNNNSNEEVRYGAQMGMFVRDTYMEAGEFDAAARLVNRMADVLHMDSLRTTPEKLRLEAALSARDTTAR